MLVVILVLVIIWRGPKTLPLLGRAFGQGVKEARREIDSIKTGDDPDPVVTATTADDTKPSA